MTKTAILKNKINLKVSEELKKTRKLDLVIEIE
jgi:hypothetical protein